MSAMATAAGVPRQSHGVGFWLLSLAALVFLMVLVGGATRLTQSGLSMVDWRPLTGILPPLTDAAWQAEFDHYQEYPEYQKLNRGMSLAAFQTIFWFEYVHRLLGRLIGLTFAIPFLWFWLRGHLRGPLAWRLAGIFLLGGLQGLVGWWMVKSGLVNEPDVSQYRLAAHLALALVILALLLWQAWQLLWPAPGIGSGSKYHRLARIAAALVFLQLLSGAFVAGLDAGQHYNTFPTMNGAWIPSDVWFQSPAWRNIFENPSTVQFNHRMGAYLVTIVLLFLWWQGRRSSPTRAQRLALDLMIVALALQFALGVLTLIHMVPVSLGVLHQAGALVLFSAVLFVAHLLRPAAEAN